jgi:hypothetical protein
MIRTYYLVVTRSAKPRVYKRYPGHEEGERVYKLNVDVPDAQPVPFWKVPEINVQAPEAPSAPTAEVSEE